MFQHIIQELITKAITQQTEKIIEKKTKKQIKKEEVYFQKPHLFISNYYQAYAFLLTLPFLLIILTLCITWFRIIYRKLFYHNVSSLS